MAGSGGSPLMIAARAGATEAVKVLLDAGAAVDALGQPPLGLGLGLGLRLGLGLG